MAAQASALVAADLVQALDRRPSAWRGHPVAQPVIWPDEVALRAVERHLSTRRPLVSPAECRRLSSALAATAYGCGMVLQAGPCVESFHDDDCAVDALAALLRELSGSLAEASGDPVVTVGRLAGQYAKPRSATTEDVAGSIVPVFRGHAMHDDAPTAAARRPDPTRLVEMYERSRRTLRVVGPHGLFASHEALLLEYEEALTHRANPGGEWYAGSAHMLWVGERTRQLDGAHVAFLSEIANPVAVKLGPAATPDQVVELCLRLNPNRRPGRLTLVTRLGCGQVEAVLEPLLAAVCSERQPVTWLCDPMHGNTRADSAGGKFRRLCDMIGEVRASVAAHRTVGSRLGGLHLEVTAEAVEECVEEEGTVGRRYTSLCDPRLNPDQARRLLDAVAGEL
jgi:3-deoxy-7-phosphoheptulonate synthase